jgi:neutral amino acid transport system substrate-binding protein
MVKSITAKIAKILLGVITCFWVVACQPEVTTTSSTTPTSTSDQLRLGIVLPATGDVASLGAPMVKGIDFLISTVNDCGGVLGKPIQVFKEDDRSEPTAGAEAVTKLVQVDKVGAIVGSFASSVSTAGIAVAAPNKVVMISPGSTSPVFTERAKNGDFNGYWYRTAPPDTYQAAALANLAYKKGFRKVSTVVINNDYGVGFEKVFVAKFKELGGQILNEAKPTRYDPKATTFEAEARSAFGGKPDAVAAVLYPETGAPLLKSAYEQGLTEGVTIMLTDGVQTEDFPQLVGKSANGKLILEGSLGTVPGADGKSLDTFTQAFTAKMGESVKAFVPHSYDAAALVVLAAEAAKSGSGEAIKSKIRDVANAPGTEVTDVCEALKLVKAGTEINYQGASGNVDLDEFGDVKGSYDVWTIEPTGKIKVIDKVSA